MTWAYGGNVLDIEPHGPLSPQIYWRRRGLALGIAALVIALLVGVLIALLATALAWAFLFRTYRGFALQVGGLAPAAARYAGFSSRTALWTALLVSGGMAGLAGALEAAGPLCGLVQGQRIGRKDTGFKL